MAWKTQLVSVLIISLGLGYSQMAGAVKCYACSYLFSGNTGTLGYDCVNDTANFERTNVISCSPPNQCVIKTVYERNYTRLLSMMRTCKIPERDTSCDVPGVVVPTCYYNCDTDLCNDKDGDLKPPPTTTTTPGTSDTIQCYACTYNFSDSDGTLDYECVNDTSKFDKKSVIPCHPPNQCVIKTVYERNYTVLLSMMKGCEEPAHDSSCDVSDVVAPTCYYNCDTDLCNGKDGDLKPLPRTTSGHVTTTTEKGPTTGAESAVYNLSLYLIMMFPLQLFLT